MVKNASSHVEYEVKFYPIEKELFRSQLKNLSATLVVPERKMRRCIFEKSSYPQLKSDYIRVRDEGNKVTLSAKIHASKNGNISDQKEIQITIGNYSEAVSLIEAMGFHFDLYQETLRETWQYNKAEIVIDTWPGLLPYIEIESDSEQSIKQVADVLHFDWDKRIITSNKEIYMQVYKLTKEKVTQLLQHLTFEDNPFTNLPTYPVSGLF